MARLSRRAFLQEVSGGLAIVAIAPRSACFAADALGDAPPAFEPVAVPDWVYGVTRMTFCSPGEVERAAAAGVQVLHTNVVWPYFPLRRDGGALPADEADALRKLMDDCRRLKMRMVLGLPPFPPVDLVRKHHEWRVHPDATGSVLSIEPVADNLGTRLGCNNGPWGDYLVEVCGELVEDFGVDGFSFDGNYHPPICYCPACRATFQQQMQREVPPAVDLNDQAYREYLVWRGERLEDHYRRLQKRIKGANPDAVLMSWTVNAGRYGHFLHSPRAMPTRLNLLFDLPMQEWWLDETNQGASVAPAFGAAYLRGATGGRPCASEPYLMSRGNPYGTDSFPPHEVTMRALLAVTNGNVAPISLGFAGHAESAVAALAEIRQREAWLGWCRALPWGAILVSEQTRQFYAYADIRERFLPHVFGAFRAATEEHLPVELINDWDLDEERLARYRVLVLPNSAALSDKQLRSIERYVERGGGLVATCEATLCDEWGRPRAEFGLAALLGAKYRGPALAPTTAGPVDANFAIALDESYWRNRSAVARLSWRSEGMLADPRLSKLVPGGSVTFRGPLIAVEAQGERAEVRAEWRADGSSEPPRPAIIANRLGQGRVVYLAAGLDAALWSYAYPYQRIVLTQAMRWAAGAAPAIEVTAPMCVQTSYFEQESRHGRRLVVHFFNGLDSAAGHGAPGSDVPLREESVPIAGIKVRLAKELAGSFRGFRVQPGDRAVEWREDGEAVELTLPLLDMHAMLVAESAS